MRIRKGVLLGAIVALAAMPASGFAQAAKQAAAPAAAGGARTIEIQGNDAMKFSVTSITAKPGEKIRVVLTSVGTMPKMVMAHNWILLKKTADPQAFANAGALARDTGFIAPAQKANVIANTTLVGAGEKAEVTFTAPKVAGQYPYLCSFPGHYAAGMKGTLTVK
jgi:azurin